MTAKVKMTCVPGGGSWKTTNTEPVVYIDASCDYPGLWELEGKYYDYLNEARAVLNFMLEDGEIALKV